MFCDMESYTHLSEGWGAEEAFIVENKLSKDIKQRQAFKNCD